LVKNSGKKDVTVVECNGKLMVQGDPAIALLENLSPPCLSVEDWPGNPKKLVLLGNDWPSREIEDILGKGVKVWHYEVDDPLLPKELSFLK